jgi:rod shape-determining protein MreC
VSRAGIRAACILAVLGLLGWHVHVRAKPTPETSFADRALLALTGPLQKGLTGLGRGASEIVQDYFWLVDVSRQNKMLSQRLASASGGLVEVAELRLENERLRQLHGLRARIPSRSVGASVIGRGVSTRFHTLRIDRGSRAGLRSGQAVVARRGAVGQVLRVSERFADVLLLTDGLSTVGAVLQDSRLRGIAAGQGGDFMELGFVRRRDQHSVAPGQLVISSGEDGLFPEGVPLARVSEVRVPETGLFLDITLKSIADLDRIEEVVVIVEEGVGAFQFPSAGASPNVWGADSAGDAPAYLDSMSVLTP